MYSYVFGVSQIKVRYYKIKPCSTKLCSTILIQHTNCLPKSKEFNFKTAKQNKSFTTNQCTVYQVYLQNKDNVYHLASLWIVTPGTRCLCPQVINNEGYGY